MSEHPDLRPDLVTRAAAGLGTRSSVDTPDLLRRSWPRRVLNRPLERLARAVAARLPEAGALEVLLGRHSDRMEAELAVLRARQDALTDEIAHLRARLDAARATDAAT